MLLAFPQVLAVSDIVIYRTRAERLHNDMYMFLSSASGAYLKHFSPELRALSNRCGLDVPLSSLGPAVIIFQETTHTQLLGQGRSREGVFHFHAGCAALDTTDKTTSAPFMILISIKNIWMFQY